MYHTYTKEDFGPDEFAESYAPEGKTQCFHCADWFNEDDAPVGAKLCESCAREMMKDPELFLEFLLDGDGSKLGVFWFEYHYDTFWGRNIHNAMFTRDLATLYMMVADRDRQMGMHTLIDEIERYVNDQKRFTEWWEFVSDHEC